MSKYSNDYPPENRLYPLSLPPLTSSEWVKLGDGYQLSLDNATLEIVKTPEGFIWRWGYPGEDFIDRSECFYASTEEAFDSLAEFHESHMLRLCRKTLGIDFLDQELPDLPKIPFTDSEERLAERASRFGLRLKKVQTSDIYLLCDSCDSCLEQHDSIDALETSIYQMEDVFIDFWFESKEKSAEQIGL